jgi:hypothetical protein
MLQDTFELELYPISDTRRENIVEKGVKRQLMILGYDKYYITDNNKFFHLVEQACIDKLAINATNVLSATCEWGIRFFNESFNSIFKILNKNTVIVSEMGETWEQFIFKEYGGKKYLYDSLLFKQCEDRLTNYFAKYNKNYNDNDFWSAVLNNTRVTNVTHDNLIQYAVQRINCGIFKIKHDDDSKFFTNAIKNYFESTTVLPKTTAIMDDAFNSTIISVVNNTSSAQPTFIQNITYTAINLINDTASTIQNHIHETGATEQTTVLPKTTAIIDDAFSSTIISVVNNTSSTQPTFIQNITYTAINLINDTIAHLTNTTSNTADHSQVNMFDESDNDTSSAVATYITIGTVVAAFVVVIVAGVTWYVRNKNSKKALLEQYIDEITAETNEDATTVSHALLNNDHAVVDIIGISAEDGTFITGAES